jgi:hypothetical protein
VGGGRWPRARVSVGWRSRITRHAEVPPTELAQITLDDATIAAIVATLASDQKPVAIEKGRIERQLKELALDHAADRVDDTTYLERAASLRKQRDALADGDRPVMSAARVVAWLRAFGDAIQQADVAEERADLTHAVYERIIVAGPEIVSARLTPEAYSHRDGARAASGGYGAPDRCWVRGCNLHHLDRGQGRVVGRG